MSQEKRLLTIKNLTVGYGENAVIEQANFIINAGDFVCVIGGNGAGKSTLIKALLGLIKPMTGEVIYGADLTRTRIGYLPQETKIAQNFPATVEEIVLSGSLGKMGKRCFYGATEKTAALKTLKTLKITNLKDKTFADLSGGQKQKVLLARALVATEKLLILDEPSNNLDYRAKQDFYQMLKKLNQEQGLTIMMITHDLSAEDLIGDKILEIKAGRVNWRMK